MDHALTLENQYVAVEVPPRKRSRTRPGVRAVPHPQSEGEYCDLDLPV
jgi:hypothetical protein